MHGGPARGGGGGAGKGLGPRLISARLFIFAPEMADFLLRIMSHHVVVTSKTGVCTLYPTWT